MSNKGGNEVGCRAAAHQNIEWLTSQDIHWLDRDPSSIQTGITEQTHQIKLFCTWGFDVPKQPDRPLASTTTVKLWGKQLFVVAVAERPGIWPCPVRGWIYAKLD